LLAVEKDCNVVFVAYDICSWEEED
jgi:hypothetical protein